MWWIFRVEPAGQSAAGTKRKVQPQTPQSQGGVVMTEPSTEAFFPTMMTVQASEARSSRQETHFSMSSWTKAETPTNEKITNSRSPSQKIFFRSIFDLLSGTLFI